MRLISLSATALLIVVSALPIAVAASPTASTPPAGEALASAADARAASVGSFLDSLKAEKGAMRELDTAETLALLGLGADGGMNAFELFDAAHRWAASAGVRLRIGEAALREAGRVYDIGRDRVQALLPLGRMSSLELGSSLAAGQPALDVTLSAPYSQYVEIGTINLEARFGFRELEPDLYLEPYGISVTRFPINAPLDRLELYAPGKGAIYVEGVPRPKRWNLWPITKR